MQAYYLCLAVITFAFRYIIQHGGHVFNQHYIATIDPLMNIPNTLNTVQFGRENRISL